MVRSPESSEHGCRSNAETSAEIGRVKVAQADGWRPKISNREMKTRANSQQSEWDKPFADALCDLHRELWKIRLLGRWKWIGKWHAVWYKQYCSRVFSPITFTMSSTLYLIYQGKPNMDMLSIAFTHSNPTEMFRRKVAFEPALDRSSSAYSQNAGTLSRMDWANTRVSNYWQAVQEVKIYIKEGRALCLRRRQPEYDAVPVLEPTNSTSRLDGLKIKLRKGWEKLWPWNFIRAKYGFFPRRR